MKRMQSILSILMLSAMPAAFAKTTQLDFVNRSATQMDYAEQHQQIVWPGFHPAKTPTVIEFGEDSPPVAYALNFTPGSLPWQKMPSNYSIYYLPDSTSLNITGDIEHKFAPVDGQLSFIHIQDPGYDEADNFGNRLILGRADYYLKHESLIDIKQAAFLKVPYDSFNNPTLLKLFYLEDAALTLSQQPDSGRAEEALRDAVAIRQYRNQLSSQSAREVENGLEIINGIPPFINWTSRALNEDDYRKMTQRTGCMPLDSLLGPLGMLNCVASGLPAFSSSVYGRALDKKLSGKPWKQEVEKQFKSISQFALDFYHFSDQEAQAIAEKAIKKPEYHYERIVRIVDSTMSPYLNAMKSAQHQYQDMPGIVFRTNFPLAYIIMIVGSFQQTFSDLYMPDSKTMMFADVNLALDPADSTNEGDLDFSVNHLPYMLMNFAAKDFDLDMLNSFTYFKLDEKVELKLDGVDVIASDFVRNKKKQAFNKIAIKDAHFTFAMTAPGVLDASDGTLSLMFTDSDEKSMNGKSSSQWISRHHLDAKKENSQRKVSLPFWHIPAY